MKSRLLVALIFIPLLVYVYLHGDLTLLVFTLGIVGIGQHEFYKMIKSNNIAVGHKMGISIGLIIVVIMYCLAKSLELSTGNIEINDSIMIILLIISFMVLAGRRIFSNKVEGSTSYIAYTMLGIVYIAMTFSYIFKIRFFENGGKWLLTIQILMWVSDSFAYFVGLSIGRKFFKKGLCEISPKKSKEGAIGSIVFTIIAMVIIRFTYFSNVSISVIDMIFIPLLVSVSGQIGDLAESLFKREFKIKDSGTLLGGHGGILDRFDSLFFAFPLVYYYLAYFVN